MLPSLTIENYVKTIYKICIRQSHRPAATGQLATALGVAPGTVTSMLKTLSEGGLAEYRPYEGVRLTDRGLKLALRVLRRHRLIELFLVQTLALSWDQVHEEAENMEHAVSDFLVDRMDEFLGRPDFDPHGDPIPRADLTFANRPAQALDTWTPGKRFRLVRVMDQSKDFLRFLTDHGLSIGVEGDLQPQHPSESENLGGIEFQVQIDDRQLTLTREAASKLLVALAEPV